MIEFEVKPRQPRKKTPAVAAQSKQATFSEMYPAIASWVKDNWMEIGIDHSRNSFVRALDLA